MGGGGRVKKRKRKEKKKRKESSIYHCLSWWNEFSKIKFIIFQADKIFTFRKITNFGIYTNIWSWFRYHLTKLKKWNIFLPSLDWFSLKSVEVLWNLYLWSDNYFFQMQVIKHFSEKFGPFTSNAFYSCFFVLFCFFFYNVRFISYGGNLWMPKRIKWNVGTYSCCESSRIRESHISDC